MDTIIICCHSVAEAAADGSSSATDFSRNSGTSAYSLEVHRRISLSGHLSKTKALTGSDRESLSAGTPLNRMKVHRCTVFPDLRCLDLVTANRDSADVSVLLGIGDGSFREARSHAAGPEPVSLALADLDNDGDLDIATANSRSGSGGLSLLVGNGAGNFQPAGNVAPEGRLRSVVAVDLNGDGALDLAVANGVDFSAPPEISVFAGNGDDTFRVAEKIDAGNDPIFVASADLDGDGVPDLAAANISSDDVSIFLNRTTRVSTDHNGNGVPDECDGGRRVPGDCDEDGVVSLSDAVCILTALFRDDPLRLPCGDGTPKFQGNLLLLDWQPDGQVSLPDVVALLRFLFRMGPPHRLASANDPAACTSIASCVDGPVCP